MSEPNLLDPIPALPGHTPISQVDVPTRTGASHNVAADGSGDLLRPISVDRVSYKNTSAKQA